MVTAHNHPELAEQVADALRADIQAVGGRLTVLEAMQLDIAQLKLDVAEVKTDVAETKRNVSEILRRLPESEA